MNLCGLQSHAVVAISAPMLASSSDDQEEECAIVANIACLFPHSILWGGSSLMALLLNERSY
jgi:hypothetical protein